MICPANWIVASLWETVACYLPPKSPSHLFSCPWSSRNLHEKTSHFKTPTLALPKFQNKKICKSYAFKHRHQDKCPPCLGFPWRLPSSGPHPAPKRSYRRIRDLFGRGIPLKTSVGLKKTPSWTNHRCSVGCWDSMISLYIYIHMFIYYIYLMIWRDFQDGCTGYLPLFHQNSCQISSFFPARIPRSPAIFPVKLWPLWRTWRQSPTDGEMSFLTLGDVGIKASRTQNGGFFCL